MRFNIRSGKGLRNVLGCAFGRFAEGGSPGYFERGFLPVFAGALTMVNELSLSSMNNVFNRFVMRIL